MKKIKKNKNTIQKQDAGNWCYLAEIMCSQCKQWTKCQWPSVTAGAATRVRLDAFIRFKEVLVVGHNSETDRWKTELSVTHSYKPEKAVTQGHTGILSRDR